MTTSLTSVIYQINCCRMSLYVCGEIGPRIQRNNKERSASIRLKNIGVTAFLDHCI